MGRPRKQDADWFKHDKDMRDDPKVKALRRKFGLEGYAVYVMMIEIFIDSDGFSAFQNPLSEELWSGDIGIATEKLKEIIEYSVQLGLFYRYSKTGFDGFFLSSRRLKLDMEALLDIRNSKRESFRRRKYTEERRVEESGVEERKDNSMSGDETSPDSVETLVDEQALIQERVPYADIVASLNLTAHTSFRCESDNTRRFIKARWNEGFRLPDFERVIQAKSAQWMRDPKMVSFLRPQTLFGSKFEAYLNESITAASSIPCIECGLRGSHRYDCSRSKTAQYEAAHSTEKQAEPVDNFEDDIPEASNAH